MSNENNDLVIFEYEAFRDRLYECARSLPTWTSTIHTLLDEHNGEENLNKLVESLTGDARPYGEVTAAWNETSQNVDTHNDSINSLIRQFQDKGFLNPSKQPLSYLYDALYTLHNYTSNLHVDANAEEKNKISSIRLALASGLEEVLPSADIMKASEVLQNTSTQEMNLQNLQKEFRDELDHIAKSAETDDIFQNINKIGDDIIPKIITKLGTIVGNERFRSELDASLKTLEQDIEASFTKAEANMDRQIKAALDELKKKLQNILESAIRPQLQQIAFHLDLFVYTAEDLKKVGEDIKNWQEQTEEFIAEFFQLPKDIQDSCERFREDFKCLEILEKNEQSAKINSKKEVEALKHLFGANGTNIFSRVNCKPEDLGIPENVEMVASHVEEIYRYQWEKTTSSSNELIRIFKHAAKRLEDINDYLIMTT